MFAPWQLLAAAVHLHPSNAASIVWIFFYGTQHFDIDKQTMFISSSVQEWSTRTNNGASRRMSNNDVRVGFLKQKCLETTPGGWQRRRRNVFAQLVPRGQETWKARLSTVDSVKVGTTRCLRNVQPADQVDQQHGRRVLGIAARFRIGLCTSVSRFCTRYALFPDNCQNCLTFEGLNEIELHRYSLNFDHPRGVAFCRTHSLDCFKKYTRLLVCRLIIADEDAGIMFLALSDADK